MLPQIQEEGARSHFSVRRMPKLDCNKNMMDVRYCGHFWKTQSTTDTLEGYPVKSWVWIEVFEGLYVGVGVLILE